MAWQCYRTGGRGERKTSAWDMMRLGLRESGGWEKKKGWASDGTAGLASLGKHGGMRGGAITTPQRTKGGRECLYLYLCVCVCVWPLPTMLLTVPPTMTVPPQRCSQCHGCQSKWLRANESPFSPQVNQLGQSNGKASCVTMRCIVNK